MYEDVPGIDVAMGGNEWVHLGPGVHLLSEESRIILERAHLRGRIIAEKHLKREPE